MEISAHEIHKIMNPQQANLEMLDRYETLKRLEAKARESRHIPYSMDVEIFNHCESDFICDYFDGYIDRYNAWRKENK